MDRSFDLDGKALSLSICANSIRRDEVAIVQDGVDCREYTSVKSFGKTLSVVDKLANLLRQVGWRGVLDWHSLGFRNFAQLIRRSLDGDMSVMGQQCGGGCLHTLVSLS